MEISTATVSVSENSVNSRPTMPPKEKQRREHRDQRQVIETTVKPTSAAPRIAASTRGTPCSR